MGLACETKTPMPTDSVSREEVEQEGATGQRVCAFTRSFMMASGQRKNHLMGTLVVCYNIPSTAIKIF